MPTEYLDSNGLDTLWQQIRAADAAVLTSANNDRTIIETYNLPSLTASSSTSYNILTSKSAVTIAQGGTGATSASAARTNLGLGTMATASASDYLLLAGGTMTGQIQSDKSSSYYNGRDYAIIRNGTTQTANNYRVLASAKTSSGSWEIAAYSEKMNFTYITDTVYASGVNTGYKNYTIDSNGAFSGSAATLTNSRTLTIGSTGKGFDGSGNVSWSLSEIGAAASGHNHALTDLTGTLTVAKGGTGATTAADARTNLAVLGTAGGTMTGTITHKHSSWDVTSPPSSDASWDIHYVNDKNDKGITFHRIWNKTTNGVMGYEFGVRRQGSSAGTTTLWNTITLDIAADGTPSVGVTHAAAWRTALGLGTMATQSSSSYLPLTGGTITGELIVQGSSDSIYAVHGVACADYEDSYFKKRMNAAAFLVGGHTTDDKFRGGLAMNSTNNRIYFRAHKTSGNARGDIFQFPAPSNTSTSSDVTYFIPIMQYGYAAANTSTNITLNRTGTWLMITGHNSTAGSNELYIVRTGANIFKVSGGTSSTMTSISISNATITLKSSNAINIYFIFLPHGTND